MAVLDHVYQKARENLIPLSVHFDLTYRCHQRCIHCYIPEAWRRGVGPGPELTTAQVKNILDQLAAAGTFFLTFSGGEIFLREDLFEILKYARALNFSVSLMASGTMGPNLEQLKILANLGAEALLLSLYSLASQEHDAITGCPGSGEQVRQITDTARKAGLQVVWNCMALSCNYPAIPVIKDLAFREGIPLRLDWRLTPRWDGKPHSPGLALRPEEKQEILRLSGGSRGEESWPEPLTVNPVFESPGCNAGASICYLTPQADVWPCIEIPHPWGRYPAVTGFLEFWQKGVRRDEFQAIFEGVSAGERPCDHFWKCQPTDGIAKVIHESSMG